MLVEGVGCNERARNYKAGRRQRGLLKWGGAWLEGGHRPNDPGSCLLGAAMISFLVGLCAGIVF